MREVDTGREEELGPRLPPPPTVAPRLLLRLSVGDMQAGQGQPQPLRVVPTDMRSNSASETWQLGLSLHIWTVGIAGLPS